MLLLLLPPALCVQVRKLVEMVLRYTLQDLHATAPFLACQVKGYRGGYTKDDRRHIERDLFAGNSTHAWSCQPMPTTTSLSWS